LKLSRVFFFRLLFFSFKRDWDSIRISSASTVQRKEAIYIVLSAYLPYNSSLCASTMKTSSLSILVWLSVASSHVCDAFVPAKGFALKARSSQLEQPSSLVRPVSSSSKTSTTSLSMGMDLVTYLRTEWISAALVSNQTPRSADVCLELGTQDGRAVSYIPKTIREFITSSAEPDGIMTVATRRQVKLQQQRRDAATGIAVTSVDQAADDLSETATESVDVVYSLQCAARLQENGRDWKRSVREAARVLKPGGRFLFVEQTTLGDESYLEYIQLLLSSNDPEDESLDESGGAVEEASEETRLPVFSEVGFDTVDLVLQPHIAGMAIKSVEAGLTPAARAARASQEQKDRLADLSLIAYERGNKKRKRKKKSEEGVEAEQGPSIKKGL
jgi:SAM-dependent methyltransferase